MELVAVLIMVACAGLYGIFYVLFLFERASEKRVERRQFYADGSPRSEFEALDEVRGILTVDGQEYSTFFNGSLTYADTIRLEFYNSPSKEVSIVDILFQGRSLYAQMGIGLSYREKAEYALNTLRNLASQGLVSHELVSEVQRIIFEVDILQDLMEEGKVYQLPNYDYAWKF